MIKKKQQQDKFTLIFEKIRSLDIKSREKMVQRHISAVQEFIAISRQENSNFSWNSCPWPVQFLPVITKFYREWGKINAVNPALSGFSGLMGMSKMEVNRRLNEEFRPRNLFFDKLPKSREILENFFKEKYSEKLNYPVIFKPNIGERASGVNFVREDQIDEFLAKNQNLQNIIFEEFVATNLEFGLSWIRDPKTEVIEIVSLVKKNTPRVMGDGKTTLRDLIISKSADLFLDKSRETKILAGFSDTELDKKIIVEKNIVRTASVSYGTSFTKKPLNSAQNKKLISLISEFLNNFAGIYAGRFDIKANNLDELLAGKCSILEMNGVGGTPLEIYDAALSIEEKYKVLFDYFSRVLVIADANIINKKGEKITKFDGLKILSKNFFGSKKTQELPESVWKNLYKVFQISLKERFKSSDLGKIFAKFKD